MVDICLTGKIWAHDVAHDVANLVVFLLMLILMLLFAIAEGPTARVVVGVVVAEWRIQTKGETRNGNLSLSRFDHDAVDGRALEGVQHQKSGRDDSYHLHLTWLITTHKKGTHCHKKRKETRPRRNPYSSTCSE
jgi:hypothetical protein